MKLSWKNILRRRYACIPKFFGAWGRTCLTLFIFWFPRNIIQSVRVLRELIKLSAASLSPRSTPSNFSPPPRSLSLLTAHLYFINVSFKLLKAKFLGHDLMQDSNWSGRHLVWAGALEWNISLNLMTSFSCYMITPLLWRVSYSIAKFST